jgi:small GTP-binding protein
MHKDSSYLSDDLPSKGCSQGVKIVVVGNANCGKTSIVRRYCCHEFSSNYKATLGADFALKTINKEGVNYKLQFWDIAGQERFGTMTSHYYRDAMAAIIVFDLTDQSSLTAVSKWKQDMDRKMTDSNIPLIILANKDDLIEGDEAYSYFNAELDKLALSYSNCIGYMYTSAYKNTGIQEAMTILIDKIIDVGKFPVPKETTLNLEESSKPSNYEECIC